MRFESFCVRIPFGPSLFGIRLLATVLLSLIDTPLVSSADRLDAVCARSQSWRNQEARSSLTGEKKHSLVDEWGQGP
jgi:hypothetical protein